MFKMAKIAATTILLALATTLSAGCSTNTRPATIATAKGPATALSSCEQSKRLPPTLAGAARTGTEQQPVLVVGCQAE